MAGGAYINGVFTARPKVVGLVSFLPGSSAQSAVGVLALVGDFPFLPQATVSASTSKSGFLAQAPNNALLKELASVIFEADDDEVGFGTPPRVLLVSPTDTTQAFAYLYDTAGNQSLKILSKMWGLAGSQARFRIQPHPSLTGYLVTITNNGFTEKFRVAPEAALMTLRYDYTGTPVVGNEAEGFDGTVAGSGAVFLSHGFLRTAVFTNGDSKLTFTAAHGLLLGDTVRLELGAGGVIPTGLAVATTYYTFVDPADTTKVLLASSLVNARAGTAIAFSDDGTGPIYVRRYDEGIDIRFRRTLPAAVIEVDGDTDRHSWVPQGPVYGDITITPDVAATLSAGTLVAYVKGTTVEDGPTEMTLTAWTAANVASPLSRSTGKTWTEIEWVALYTTGGGAYVGNIYIEGRNFRTLNAASGHATVADAIAEISEQQQAGTGFVVGTKSTKAGAVRVLDLDYKDRADAFSVTTTFSVDLTATSWKILSVVNSSSSLVELEDVGDFPPDVPSGAGVQRALGGGTETAAATADWQAALDELRYFDVTDLWPMRSGSDIADPTSPELDAIFEAFIDHTDDMWSNGANERYLWLGAPNGASFDTLMKWSVFGDEWRVSIAIDAPEIVSWDGSAKTYDPHWAALSAAAMVCSSPRNISLTGKKPRWAGATRHAALYADDVISELVAAGLMVATSSPGESIKWERDVTSWTADTKVTQTERPAVRSAMEFQRGARAALKVWNSNLDASAAAIAGDFRQYADAAVNQGIITSYLDSSLKVVEYPDRYEPEIQITPKVPRNFIFINTKIAIPRVTTSTG